ncbi:MAG: acyl-CoA dehydratase activase [Myxococcota bacterium]|nr:acyl-CoA dehydratase activase [Myxococcota bacterium]
MICAGVDAGSRTIKVVLIDPNDRTVIGSGIADQGVKQAELAEQLLEQVCHRIDVSRSDIGATVATGYGRNAIAWATRAITEITCQARGVHHCAPDVKTIIDIGGQDSKLLRLGPNGKVRDFVMNDRCAAGTGRFLEVVAAQFDIDIVEMGEIAKRADTPCAISSMCVVFAETEIVGLLASGESPENLLAGVEHSVASRIRTMAGRKIEAPIVFTGGVALVTGMAEVLGQVMGHPVTIAKDPQLTGALGAALLAIDQLDRAP